MAAVLADSSIWVAHFRSPSPLLQELLAADLVLSHPLIVLELACGTPPTPRERVLADLRLLRSTTIATTEEILGLVERERFYDVGCGAVDLSLLTSARLTPGTQLWTYDRPLEALAIKLGIAYRPR